jgi:hypothetical protein
MTTYKNKQNFHGDWYFKITGRTSASDDLCMYGIKICDKVFDEFTPIVLDLHVCRCWGDNHSSEITVSLGMKFSFTNTNTVARESLCARGT